MVGNRAGWNKKYDSVVAEGRIFPSVIEMASMGFTFLLVVVGWIIFRAVDVTQAFGFFYTIANNPIYDSEFQILYIPIIAILLMILVEWVTRSKQHVFELPAKGWLVYKPVRWGVYYVLVLAIYRFWGFAQDFIYFQF